MSKLKDKIRVAQDRGSEKVTVPEWGCELFVQALSGKQLEEYEAATTKLDKKGNVAMVHKDLRAKLLAQTLHEVGDDGSMGPCIFSDSPEDLELLSGKSGGVLNRLAEIAQRLSGIGVKAQEDIQKN